MSIFKRPRETKASKKTQRTQLIVISGCAGSGKTTLGRRLAQKLNYTYLDKDTITREYTDRILSMHGLPSSDRESDFYRTEIVPIEYSTSFRLCGENLDLGNSVVLTIPFITQIRSYSLWEKLRKQARIDSKTIDIKFIWINHDIDKEHERIINRAAERDGYKLSHWFDYEQSVNGIIPDPQYNAYTVNNDEKIDIDELIDEVIEQCIEK